MTDEIRRRELADFLRTRRARLSPESTGLVRGLRRRTPGLRREEVAELAGLGVAWYTWLEQGRPINVSDDVLGAVARALRLNDDERKHLFSLARKRSPAALDGRYSSAEVSDCDLAVLDALDPNPAHIRDSCWNLLAMNRAFAGATGFDQVPEEDRNLLWLLFTEPSCKALGRDWDEMARFAVSQFRFEVARDLDRPEAMELIERLRGVSPEFRELWSYHDVYSGAGSRTVWVHPSAGVLEFERSTLSVGTEWLLAGAGQRLNVLVPVPGTGTEDHLRLLTDAA